MYIERMEAELKELNEKIEKADLYLMSEIDEPKTLNDAQKIMLGIQISHMINYANTLKERIKYERNMIKKERL